MEEKPIIWKGSSREDLLGFPRDAMRDTGYQLSLVQLGLEPVDGKPFSDVGAGVKEIRIKDETGIFRVMYIAKFEEAIYVLHCFQKKSQKTSKKDTALAKARYKAVIVDRAKR